MSTMTEPIEDAARDLRTAAAELHDLVAVQQARHAERVELLDAYAEVRRLRDELTVRRALRARLTHCIFSLSDQALCLVVIGVVTLTVATITAVGVLL